MADQSSIEWTDTTWNPVAGCKIASAGCTNHQFRYGGAETVTMPELDATLQAHYALCDELRHPIEQALKEVRKEVPSRE